MQQITIFVVINILKNILFWNIKFTHQRGNAHHIKLVSNSLFEAAGTVNKFTSEHIPFERKSRLVLFLTKLYIKYALCHSREREDVECDEKVARKTSNVATISQRKLQNCVSTASLQNQ